MNIILNINSISSNNIYFYDSVKNTIINNSNFIKITYSNNYFILNGIYIKITIHKNSKNDTILDKINNLETLILSLYNNNKIYNYKIIDQINYLITKLNNSNKDIINYILKISGIWETDSNIGLTYKFILI